MRKEIPILILVSAFGCIVALFWYNEWRYSLPTPVPARYRGVSIGEHIEIAGKVRAPAGKPLFLHFFNPDCPCSRFNMPHFRELVQRYSDTVSFAVVVMTRNSAYTAALIKERYGLKIPVLFDSSVAAACGVYSTPQAVLLTAGQTLYYRGNYNRSRYCTDKKSKYAQAAIDSLLSRKTNPVFNLYARTAYGCSLPESCTQ